MNNPPCANWNVWEGLECEGEEDFGVLTLFIRDNFQEEDLHLFEGYTRVWFTREFRFYSFAVAALAYGLKVCIEVTPDSLEDLPEILKAKATLYLVLPSGLKPTDFVKNGDSFSETVTRLNKKKTNKKLYYKDRRIK